MLAESWDVAGNVVLVKGLVLSCASLVPRFLRRKQPRCPTCSYDLTGVALTPVPKCPECGKQARSAKRLFRGRMHRRILASGVMLSLLCNVPYSVPRVEEAGWVGAVPSTALAIWYPYFTPDRADRQFEQDGPMEAEFVRRFMSERRGSDDKLGPIMSRIVALRCELAFRLAGRWGASTAERLALSNFKGDVPKHRTDQTESIDQYLRTISTATGRPTSIDAEGFRQAGLDPALLQDATRGRPDDESEFPRAFRVQSGPDGAATTTFAHPVCFRGTVVLTPRPEAFACLTVVAPVPGATARETEILLWWGTDTPHHLQGTMYDSYGHASVEQFGDRIVIYGSEASIAAAQRAYAIACEPLANPWAPAWFVDVSVARPVFDRLERTFIPGSALRGTVREALTAITLASGIPIEFTPPESEGSNPPEHSEATDATISAAAALDVLAGRLGVAACWDISQTGAVELTAELINSRYLNHWGVVAIYDTPGLNDVPTFPYDAWEGLLLKLPEAEHHGYVESLALRQSRYACRATLVFHFRAERLLRPIFQGRSASCLLPRGSSFATYSRTTCPVLSDFP